MGNRPAPSLPTPKQIKATAEAVQALHPGAVIGRVGPEGVSFIYPDQITLNGDDWRGQPFSAD